MRHQVPDSRLHPYIYGNRIRIRIWRGIRTQVCDDKNLKILQYTVGTKILIFYQILHYISSEVSVTDFRRSLQLSTSSFSNYDVCELFFGIIIFAFLDPDPDAAQVDLNSVRYSRNLIFSWYCGKPFEIGQLVWQLGKNVSVLLTFFASICSKCTLIPVSKSLHQGESK